MTQEQRQLVTRDEAWVPKADRQFWYTVKKIKKTTSYKFDLADKKYIVDFEVFRKILGICLKVQGEEFVETPSKESLLTFLIELGYKSQLNKLPNMFVDYMHQPWRTLAAIINKLKFVRTGEDFQEYGRAILNMMLTEEIQQSESYKAFISYFIGLIPPKKSRGKGSKGKKTIVTPKEKVSISVNERFYVGKKTCASRRFHGLDDQREVVRMMEY
ncbi:hypothetical protein Tco_1206214 [Tanacetum coccineum]